MSIVSMDICASYTKRCSSPQEQENFGGAPTVAKGVLDR